MLKMFEQKILFNSLKHSIDCHVFIIHRIMGNNTVKATQNESKVRKYR